MEAIRDKSHIDFIKRWAKRVREDKTQSWRLEHAKFINSQYSNAYRIIDLLKKTKKGKEKLRRIYGIKNPEGYPSFY